MTVDAVPEGGQGVDVYYPTIDNTNVETLQYIVTDGSTFTDLQTRDMVSTATSLDDSGMVCRVTSKANSGKYQIVTDYITDPDRNTLLMKTRFVPAKHTNLKLYVRFDPTVNAVLQSDELDYTLHTPVTIQGVAIS